MPWVEDLPPTNGEVPIIFEELWNGCEVAAHIAEIRVQIPHARRVRVAAGEHARSRGRADCLLHLCLAKEERLGDERWNELSTWSVKAVGKKSNKHLKKKCMELRECGIQMIYNGTNDRKLYRGLYSYKHLLIIIYSYATIHNHII